MDSQIIKCPQCGATMKQAGTMQGSICYKCEFCGQAKVIKPEENQPNTVYWMKRAELFSRVRKGILNWEGTNWDYLYNDIVEFTGNYEEARDDVYFRMAIVACVTEGYNTMNKEKYKRCKAIFKVTEKCYKMESRSLKDSYNEAVRNRLAEYEEYRNMYKQCRNEYRNTKLYWKIVKFVFKQAFLK